MSTKKSPVIQHASALYDDLPEGSTVFVIAIPIDDGCPEFSHNIEPKDFAAFGTILRKIASNLHLPGQTSDESMPS